MARKPPRKSGVARSRTGAKPARQRDYRAEYARRKARGEALGKKAQEYRGHKTPAGISESQQKRLRAQQRIVAFATRQAQRFPGTDASTIADIVEALMPKIRAQGMTYLRNLEAEIARMNREYMGQTKRDKRGRRLSVGYSLDTLSETWDLPPETFGYH